MDINHKIKAVIFDMDGLMIDSEPYHQKAFDQVLRKYGSSLSTEENNKYVGLGDTAAAVDIISRKKLQITVEDLLAQKESVYLELLQSSITANEGLLDLLVFLKRNTILSAIASGSSVTEIEAVIKHLYIETFFDFYCSSTQVPQRKPAPDIFLYAAKHLGVSPSECVVLEDAPSGLRAGKAANIPVIIVPSNETKDKDFSTADHIVSSLCDVPELLAKYYL